MTSCFSATNTSFPGDGGNFGRFIILSELMPRTSALATRDSQRDTGSISFIARPDRSYSVTEPGFSKYLFDLIISSILAISMPLWEFIWTK